MKGLVSNQSLWGPSWQEIEGVLPLAANQALPPTIPILDPSPTFDMSFYKFLIACGQ